MEDTRRVQLSFLKAKKSIGQGLAGKTATDSAPHEEYEKVLRAAFDRIDASSNNVIEKEEMVTFFQEACGHMNIQDDENMIDLAVDDLFDEANADRENGITVEAFLQLFRENPDLYFAAFRDAGTTASSKQSLFKEDGKQKSEAIEVEEIYEKSRTKWHNRPLAVFWLVLYIAGTTALFAATANLWAGNQEARDVFGNCVIVARSCAKVLNLHGALVLILISRHFMTFLESSIKFPFPFDASIQAHILVGLAFGIFSLVHTLAHVCDIVRFIEADETDLEQLFGDTLGDIPVEKGKKRLGFLLKQPFAITGVAMVVAMIPAYYVMINRRAHFNRFWSLHHLLILMIILMCLHGIGNALKPFETIYWLAGPLAIYLAPRLYREVKKPETVIETKVRRDETMIRLKKPEWWKKTQKAGMYAFVNVRKISRWEWHPFTVSSCPHDEYVQFDIKELGDWTGELRNRLVDKKETVDAEKSKDEEACNQNKDLSKPKEKVFTADLPEVRIQGPFGAPAQHICEHSVVVLVAASIGVTPMMSVLRQLLHEPGKVEKAYFFWAVRDREAFEWVSASMDEIFVLDKENRFEIRNYLTSMQVDERDLGTVLFRHAPDHLHKDTKTDIVTGFHAKKQIEIGRPVWKKELQQIIDTTRNTTNYKKVSVFLCGPHGMSEEVQGVCEELTKETNQFQVDFRKERFSGSK